MIIVVSSKGRNMMQSSTAGQNDQSYIILTGIKNSAKVDSYFASSMVDVAAVTEMSADSVKVVPDTGIDLSKQEDVDWLAGIILFALSECEESQAAIEIHIEC